MIRRHVGELRALLMLTDAAVALLVVAALSRVPFRPDWETALGELFTPAWVPLLLYIIGWVVLLYLEGQYRLRVRWRLRTEIAGILRASLWIALLSTTGLFFSRSSDVSRLFLVILFPVQAVATITTRAVLRWWLRGIRRGGRNTRNVLVLGTGPRAVAFATQVEEHRALGLRVIGFLGEGLGVTSGRWPYLGLVSSLQEVLHANVVDEVAVCLSLGDWSRVESVARLCQDEGKIVRIPLEIPQFGSGLRFVEDLDGTAVLSLVQGPDRILAVGLKRLFDILASAMALVLLSPVLLAVAIGITLTEGRPIVFTQPRVGLHGRRFRLVKFRTMVPDAEQQLDTLRHRNEMNGHVFKITADPRITRIGRWLRRTSLDELPQLWNVLKGDMSLVGPRPPLPAEVDGYDIWHRRRLSMKPGITGLWQVQARRDPDFDHWVQKDLEYIDRWSLLLDLWIVLRTVPAVLRLEGR